jgi:uncharacterized membrane protein YbaN (DUF454 family)
MSDIRRALLIAGGTLSVGLGIVGIFLPVLPTTPFLLLGAALYVRSSPTLYGWLMNQRYLGTYIRNYRDGKGIPLAAKVLALVLLWSTISYSALVVLDSLLMKIVLFAIAIAVTVHLAWLPTLKK